MFAILEVDVYRVEPSKRSEVQKEVLLALGPPDPTVVVEEEGEVPQLSVQELLTVLKEYGEVVLVRVTEDSTFVTFKTPPSALAALTLNGQKVWLISWLHPFTPPLLSPGSGSASQCGPSQSMAPWVRHYHPRRKGQGQVTPSLHSHGPYQ